MMNQLRERISYFCKEESTEEVQSVLFFIFLASSLCYVHYYGVESVFYTFVFYLIN